MTNDIPACELDGSFAGWIHIETSPRGREWVQLEFDGKTVSVPLESLRREVERLTAEKS